MWFAKMSFQKIKNALAILTKLTCKNSLCTICTIDGKSAESANSAMQKFT